MAVGAPGPAPPWRPSRSQAAFIAALCGPAASGADTLEAWLREDGARPLDAGLVPLLPFAFQRLVDIDPDAEITRLAQAAYLANAKVNLLRTGRLLAGLRRFAEAGIATVVLKGAALALRYYGNLGARAMADVDVLVRPADVARASDLLADLGWTAAGDSSAAFLRTTMRVQHARPFSAGPAHSLDLHWRPLKVVTPDVEEAFWSEVEPFDVDGIPVRVLGPTDQIFHACCHAVQPTWAPSPHWMLDVHAILQASGTRVRWDRLVDTAKRTHTTARLNAAVVALEGVMGDRIPPVVLDALATARAPRWERRELSLYERMPPFSTRDRLRWHWYTFRRLREADATWRGQPLLPGFLDYVRLKLEIRAKNARHRA